MSDRKKRIEQSIADLESILLNLSTETSKSPSELACGVMNIIGDLDKSIEKYRKELSGGRMLMPSIYDYYNGKLCECIILKEKLENLL